MRILQFPGLKTLNTRIPGGKLTLFCAGEASAGFPHLAWGDQGQDALPDQGSAARGGGQTDVHLHPRLHRPVPQDGSLQAERSLLQLVHRLQGLQSLTQSRETCRGSEDIRKIEELA